MNSSQISTRSRGLKLGRKLTQKRLSVLVDSNSRNHLPPTMNERYRNTVKVPRYSNSAITFSHLDVSLRNGKNEGLSSQNKLHNIKSGSSTTLDINALLVPAQNTRGRRKSGKGTRNHLKPKSKHSKSSLSPNLTDSHRKRLIKQSINLLKFGLVQKLETSTKSKSSPVMLAGKPDGQNKL